MADLPEDGLAAGDMGAIVEFHSATRQYSEGYEVEFFAGNGDTLAVVSVPAAKLCAATRDDVPHVRELSMA